MLNSVFCILQKIIVLRKVGCFTVAVIKKGGTGQIMLTKDMDYTMMLMTIYGTLERSGNESKGHIIGDIVGLNYL